MIRATLILTEGDLNEAVAEWLVKKGIATTDRFSVSVKEIPSDGPYGSKTIEITASGVVVGRSE